MDHQRIADEVLTPLWRGVPSAYKMKYARSIWQQFEDQIRSSAYTSRLTTWLDDLCRKLDIAIRAEYTEAVAGVIASGQDRAVLSALRDETTYLVLLVRIANDERKAEANQTTIFTLTED
jgi:HPt (histidine-containing phosphotransfer) domain-containing protein